VTNRRSFLAGLFVSSFAPHMTWADVGAPKFLSGAQTHAGKHVLCGLSEQGDVRFECPLPTRGHGAAAHPVSPLAVVFARRPGTYAIVLNCRNGTITTQLDAPEGRHFYGHGCFSADGSLLFTTENDYENGAGIIGVWDVWNNFRRVNEFSSGGVGPHDIALLPTADTIVVANGGIETHPETGRVKLNIPTMRSNLTYIAFDGRILGQVSLDVAYQKNSIRHLCVNDQGQVGFAMQWQGDVAKAPPLFGIYEQGEHTRLFDVGDTFHRLLNGYIGSAAFDNSGRYAVVTSPKGGLALHLDLLSEQVIAQYEIPDVCGVVESTSGFLLTSGTGNIIKIEDAQVKNRLLTNYRWDNHLIRI